MLLWTRFNPRTTFCPWLNFKLSPRAFELYSYYLKIISKTDNHCRPTMSTSNNIVKNSFTFKKMYILQIILKYNNNIVFLNFFLFVGVFSGFSVFFSGFFFYKIQYTGIPVIDKKITSKFSLPSCLWKIVQLFLFRIHFFDYR